ncbi:hypothetical protein BZA05DRAFT_399666 [Tricharina praecox]|uniref:uncharacterized protein n=1 Tax=Tricharina praecox TaxID=43433 RepID=UPI00221F0876|nr:uncharacterized protein BZA05DRAFT_399666 [Tricharina praecox]KAI5850592.1 hypothetical protein BZA05DRAFT_399666 [Tricharina praecox]
MRVGGSFWRFALSFRFGLGCIMYDAVFARFGVCTSTIHMVALVGRLRRVWFELWDVWAMENGHIVHYTTSM